MSHPITNPILLPEILCHIARYIPLFEPSTDDHFHAYTSYTPENLYPCLLVSRLWYQCFIPHLYHYFVHSIMTQDSLPRPILAKHRPHFRRAILDNVGRPLDSNFHDLLDLPTNLLGLTVHSVDGDPFSHLHLLRNACGPRLRELTWYGRNFSSALDTPWDIVGTFASLEDLVLVRWDLTSDQLRTVLLGCCHTLRSLRMHTVSGYGPDVFLSNNDNNSLDQPQLELSALRELYLMLDWPQSRAVIHLPRICPALEVLHLNVDLEEFDLRVMIDYCQKHCPKLHSVLYHEGYSMRHEYGYYPDPELYAALFKNSARHLRSVLIPLPTGLDTLMLDALQSQARTLERIELRMMRGCTLDVAMLALLLQKTTALKSLVLDKINVHVQNLNLLCEQPWACRDLEILEIQGYNFEPRMQRVLDLLLLQIESEQPGTINTVDTTDPSDTFVYSDGAYRMYEGDGQGWYLQQGLSEKSYAKAAQNREIKERLFRHMHSSRLHRVRRVTLNWTDFFAEEQPPLVATDSNSDSESDSAS
ncbi:hypothetical protein BGZ70_010640 [Mortierella alpina]|uniref:F-box domain-containing protein n=1 Tax=Mortierella alpina TaxID=64518 RepID=A0A9P6IYP8_MORAP|nr:hypothetical protein BGZ70_010640 [Mortierella alpina]